jgi:hypothetical protein
VNRIPSAMRHGERQSADRIRSLGAGHALATLARTKTQPRQPRAATGRLSDRVRGMHHTRHERVSLPDRIDAGHAGGTVGDTDQMTVPTRTRAMPSDLPIYQAVTARRMQRDFLLWQVPSLSWAAQALLLTIALGPGSSRFVPVACVRSRRCSDPGLISGGRGGMFGLKSGSQTLRHRREH